jgi:hypothetical protein
MDNNFGRFPGGVCSSELDEAAINLGDTLGFFGFEDVRADCFRFLVAVPASSELLASSKSLKGDPSEDEAEKSAGLQDDNR